MPCLSILFHFSIITTKIFKQHKAQTALAITTPLRIIKCTNVYLWWNSKGTCLPACTKSGIVLLMCGKGHYLVYRA